MLIVYLLASVGVVRAQSPTYKPFRVDVSAGLNVPTKDKVGNTISIEPKYALSDRLALGLRFESSTVLRDGPTGQLTDGRFVRSYAASGDYYLNADRYRFFAGLVTGIYQRGTAMLSDKGIEATLDSFPDIRYESVRFGLAPRVGFELSHLRVSAEYNFITARQTDNINYLALKAGVIIGGGKSDR